MIDFIEENEDKISEMQRYIEGALSRFKYFEAEISILKKKNFSLREIIKKKESRLEKINRFKPGLQGKQNKFTLRNLVRTNSISLNYLKYKF